MNQRDLKRRLQLPDVTLVAVTSVALRPTLEALQVSMRQAHFGEVLLLSDRLPPGGVGPIEWRRTRPLKSRIDYSQFMLRELADHIATSHALCIQWDGYVLDGRGWDDAFLNFDYIGAVWPQFSDGHRVGNGGFSLRSLRLLEACRHLPFDAHQAEDLIIGRVCRWRLEEQGLTFAPEEVARQFSYERTPPTGREFGFHGAFNLVHHRAPADALRTFESLEPELLTNREHRELLRWAIACGLGRLALTLLRRLTRRWREYCSFRIAELCANRSQGGLTAERD
jgi:hypothetical protein